MKIILSKGFVHVLALLIITPASGETLLWNPNPEPNIAGYKVYYGEVNVPPTIIDVGKGTSRSFPSLLNGRSYYFYLTAYSTSGLESNPSQILTFTKPSSTAFAGIFYNNSAWDGNSSAPNALDDGAIASDKIPLLPGQKAVFANYTSFHRGINGLMLDIVGGLGGQPTVGDFDFRVGNSDNLAPWSTAPPPFSITVRPGAGGGGSDRITIIWPDGAIQNQWLELRVRANSTTRLASPAVFYFGNAIGDSGNSILNAQVDVSDENAARQNPRNGLNPAPIDDPYDFNRDKRVDVSDENLTRVHRSNFLTALKLIDLSGLAALSQASVDPLLSSSSPQPGGTAIDSAPADSGTLKLTITLTQDGSLRLEPTGTDLSAVRIHTSTNLSAGPWEDLASGPQEFTAGLPITLTFTPDKSTSYRFFRTIRD